MWCWQAPVSTPACRPQRIPPTLAHKWLGYLWSAGSGCVASSWPLFVGSWRMHPTRAAATEPGQLGCRACLGGGGIGREHWKLANFTVERTSAASRAWEREQQNAGLEQKSAIPVRTRLALGSHGTCFVVGRPWHTQPGLARPLLPPTPSPQPVPAPKLELTPASRSSQAGSNDPESVENLDKKTLRRRDTSLTFIQNKLQRLGGTSLSSGRSVTPTADSKGALGLTLLHEPSEPRIDFIFVRASSGHKVLRGQRVWDIS